MLIPLFLSLHFYLLHLLLNKSRVLAALCARETVQLLHGKYRILSVQICVRQTVWLTRKPS